MNIAQNNLCIQSVNLKESKIFVRDDIDPSTLDRDETAAQSFRSFVRIKEISLTDPEGGENVWDYRFTYSVGIRLIFLNEKEESVNDEYKPILEIVGVFEAKYLSKSQLKEEELKAFSADNVGYHVWPYWREYVQSTCARIGFSPAFEVPVYIIPPRDEMSEADGEV
ncbi:MAG: hypothetical protein L3J88_12815 [Gammaproteobacteria bacterium]|nr:hypothetical protein [Gammaproteobacteria bacterium]MCF6364195.1 hypothetical protein [Gammaproteobacteria bacterium]